MLVFHLGGVDLLLHLLSNIVHLPVTKEAVKESGMGKAIGSIEKHPICAGTPNEGVIRDRLLDVKTAWNASVKANKAKELPNAAPQDKKAVTPGIEPVLSKRMSSGAPVPITKRFKANDGAPIKYSLSSYMNKVVSKADTSTSVFLTKSLGVGSPESTFIVVFACEFGRVLFSPRYVLYNSQTCKKTSKMGRSLRWRVGTST
jgi:hypothetical protein